METFSLSDKQLVKQQGYYYSTTLYIQELDEPEGDVIAFLQLDKESLHSTDFLSIALSKDMVRKLIERLEQIPEID